MLYYKNNYKFNTLLFTFPFLGTEFSPVLINNLSLILFTLFHDKFMTPEITGFYFSKYPLFNVFYCKSLLKQNPSR